MSCVTRPTLSRLSALSATLKYHSKSAKSQHNSLLRQNTVEFVKDFTQLWQINRSIARTLVRFSICVHTVHPVKCWCSYRQIKWVHWSVAAEPKPLLPYNTLHCITLHCKELYLIVLYSTVLHYTVQNYTELQKIALYCTALHCTALHCCALHCSSVECSVGTLSFLSTPSSPHRPSGSTPSPHITTITTYHHHHQTSPPSPHIHTITTYHHHHHT